MRTIHNKLRLYTKIINSQSQTIIPENKSFTTKKKLNGFHFTTIALYLDKWQEDQNKILVKFFFLSPAVHDFDFDRK